jgi:hypothetical protein
VVGSIPTLGTATARSQGGRSRRESSRLAGQRANEERTATRAQQETLDRNLRDVQSLIDAGQYFKPEVALDLLAAGHAAGGNVDRHFVCQYEERCEALAKLLERRRSR